MAINPLQAPINYSAQMVDLTPAFSGIGQAFQQLGETQAAQAKTEAAKVAKQQFASDLETAQNTGTQAGWLEMVGKYPQFREAFGDVRKGVGEERVKNEFNQGFEISNALENNAPEVAIDRVKTIIKAKSNSGESTKIYDDVLTQLEAGNIKGAQNGVNFALIAIDPDRFEKGVKAKSTAAEAPAALSKKVADAEAAVSDAAKKAAEAKDTPARLAAEQELRVAQAAKAAIEAQFAGPLAQANLNLNTAQIKKINNEISNAAARLNLDTKTMQATVAEKLSSIQKNLNDLPEATRKLINDSAVAAAVSKQSANQYNDLAKRLDEAGGGYGAATSFADYLRKQTGAQSPLTDLRQEYTRIRNSAAIKSLPAGPATDKDIELALKGIPPENADARTVASFLRGIGKMQDIEASVGNAKTDWLANNNGVLTRAKDTFIAGDYTTKPGETFNDFTQRVVVDVSKRYRSPAQKAEEDRAATMAKIPTTGTPAAAPTVNVRAQADAILSGGR